MAEVVANIPGKSAARASWSASRWSANQRSLGWISDAHRRRDRRQDAVVVVDRFRLQRRS